MRWRRSGRRIDSVRGDSAFATLTESNEFYDLLGVGPRTRREIFVARAGRIPDHAGADDGASRRGLPLHLHRVKRWVIDTAKVRDTVLVGDGVLRFTAASAEPMRRWLTAWRKR
jgi:hypothetical protein